MANQVAMTLPAALPAKEQQKLLERIHNGETELREIVIHHNLRLVAYVARKFSNTGIDHDELFQIGCLGLMKASKTYDYSKNYVFATYASRCIENEILMSLRKSTTKGRGAVTLRLDAPIAMDADGKTLMLDEVIEDPTLGPEDGFISKKFGSHRMEVFKLYMKNVDERTQQIWFYTYLDTSQNDLSKILGISQSYISRLMKRDTEAMKRMLKHYLDTGELKYFKRRGP